MTSQMELIKVQVFNRLADAAELFVQVMVHNRAGLKVFCCEQSFCGASEWFEDVFGQQL